MVADSPNPVEVVADSVDRNHAVAVAAAVECGCADASLTF